MGVARIGAGLVAAALSLLPTIGAATAYAGAAADERPAAVRLPTPNVGFDYQIGGAFAPAPSVGIVSRDRKASPSSAPYDVCYVNAFQTQPDEKHFWRDVPAHWRLVLKDGKGRPVVDGAWGEWLLDIRTPAKRAALMRIVGPWIAGCDRSGFDAVEFDNLDSFNRSKHLLDRDDTMAFARLLTGGGHAHHLATAQKNWSELGPRGPRLGFDFAISEECARYAECGRYAAAYDGRVYDIEYRDRDFARACSRWPRLSIVQRDLDVSPHGVNRRC